MKRFKRIVGFLLSVAMVLSFVPVTHTHVHAETVQPGTTTTTTDPIKTGTTLNIVPASSITTVFGCYTDGTGDNESTFSDGEDGYCVTDGWYGRAGDSVKTSADGLIALVMTLDSATTLGAIELIGRKADYNPAQFEVQAWVDGAWKQVVEQNTNAFTSNMAQTFEFSEIVTTSKVRVLVHKVANASSKCSFLEAILFEASTGNVKKMIDLSECSLSSDNNANHPAVNLVNSDKSDVFLGTYVTVDLTSNGHPTSVDGVNLHIYRGDNAHPTEVTIQVQRTAGGSFETIGTYATNWSNSDPLDSLVIAFDQTYDAYGVSVRFDAYGYVSGLEMFQYERSELADPNAPAVPGTTQAGTYDYAKIPLSKSNVVGACSEGSTGKNYINESGDFSKVEWYTTGRPTWRDFSLLFDGIHTNDVHWGIDDTERGDFLLDLGESGTAVDRIKLYGAYYSEGYNVPTEITVMLLLKGGGTKTVVINTGWKDDSSAQGALCTYDLDQTYTITGVYVWASSNGGSDEAIFGDFELWQKDPIPLPTPNLAEAAKTENSITVTANKLSPSTAGTLKFKIDDGAWQTATSGYYYTFTGLDAGSTHTIKAKYVANDSGYTDSPEATLSITTDAGVQRLPDPSNFTVTATSANSITVTADLNANGKLKFRRSNSSKDNWATEWLDADANGSYTFTGLEPNSTYQFQARYWTNNAAYEHSAIVEISSTTSSCEHDYGNVCTGTVCSKCGEEREAPGHIFTNCSQTECQRGCGHTRAAIEHSYTNCEDTTCNNANCNQTRDPLAHTYDNACDAECNICHAIRDVPDHVYDNACDADCNVCGATRTPSAHVYDNACDTDCNECGATRTVGDHVYSHKYDTTCNECGATRTVTYPTTAPGDLVEVKNPAAPVIGYYTDLNGNIVDYSNNSYPASNLVNGDTTDQARSDYFTYEEVANGTKVPAILFNLGKEMTLGAIEVWGYEASRYNMEDFEVQVYVDGAWKTVTATVDAFEGTFGADLAGSLTLYFDAAYTTSQVRILVSAMSDMRGRGDGSAGDAELETGSYVRVREIKLYEVDCEHVFSDCEDTECNNGCGYTRDPIGHSYTNCEQTKCANCDATREALTHVYGDCEDTTCNNANCNETRTAPGHKYTNACTDEVCSVCQQERTAPGHDYDGCDDTECSVCGETREAGTHTYTNVCTDTECSICGEERTAPGHTFDHTITGNCDKCVFCNYVKVITSHIYDDTCADSDCNVCGAIREANHTYSNACDATCSECGYVRDAAHVFDNNCDAECNACGTVRKITHVYDSVCDADCNECGLLRDAPHSVTDRCATGQTCSICGVTFATALHVYTDVCDDICNVCGDVADEALGRAHVFDNACDTTCSRCGCVREAIHVFDSIYDTTCNSCGFVRDALEEPTGLPSYPGATKLTLTDPIFGYYTDNDTNGAITNWYETGVNAGITYGGPNMLVDGTVDTKWNRAQSKNYNYVELREKTKVPVILFTFSEAVNVCKMNIYGYLYNYYNIEDFRVQVLTEDGWVTVSTITNAFTDGTLEADISGPLEITFDKAYETTQVRILVDGITNMYGRGDGTTGNDVFGHEASFRIREIELYSTPVVVEQLDNVTINGAHISQYKIVYSDSEPDYNETAAQYIQSAIYKKTGYTLEILEDNATENACEILVGHTNRSLSSTFEAPANNVMKFNMKANGTKIAMEADYFIIAGAAYYFAQKYVPTASGQAITVPETLQTLVPITEAPNNYIMLIGDGMGVNQTKLFDVYNVTESRFTSVMDISDNEDIFYGYYFPYQGRSHTWNVMDQITDSAAGGSALSTGYKTTNGTVGKDWYGNDVKNLSELALELGLAAGVFSTEGSDGATPASFSVHSDGRYDDEIPDKQVVAEQNGMLFVDRYYVGGPDVNCEQLTESEWNTYEAKIKAGLNTLASDPDGFFLMYEEAHIDKYLHKADALSTFKALYRFNQAIGIFMEYAMYNPDTIVLITADHETGGITLGANDSGSVTFNTPNPPDEGGMNHSNQDVPVFAYGFGMEVFATDYENGEYYENASIGRTYAHFMTNGHADDFGDPWYPILVNGTTLVEYPDDPLTVKNSETLNKLNIAGKGLNANLTDGSKSTSATINVPNGDTPAILTIDLTNNGEPTNIKKMLISATSTSTGPATTIVEAQVKVNGELVWLQIYKDTLYGTMYGEDFETNGILDFHTFYNAYQVRIQIDSVNTTGGYGNLVLTEIELYGYDVYTPDLGGVVTTGGDANGVTTIQLMQNGAEVYKTTTTGRYYHIDDVAAGTYTVVATKDGHITAEYDLTVGTEPVRLDVELKYVSDNAKRGLSQSVRLIEPWAIRSFILFGNTETQPLYLTGILGYGAYAVIEHKAGDVAPDSWDDIVYNEKAIKFEKSFTAGDEKISHTSANGHNRRYTVAFDFYDMLYTYRMAEQVYWIAYYEDAEGIHFTSLESQSMSDIIDTIKAENVAPADEVAVLDDMKALHQSLIDYRGADADIGNTDYPEPITLANSGLMNQTFNTGSYKYGRRHQIRLIEPWGFKVTLRVAPTGGSALDLKSAAVEDVGMIFYHDKVNEYFNSGMGSKDILAREDAVVFSKQLGNLFTLEGDSAIAVYDKGIYTYQLDTELYFLAYVKIGGKYYCQQSATRWNIRDEMTTFRDDTTRDILERDVFEDMVNLYFDVKKYRGL